MAPFIALALKLLPSIISTISSIEAAFPAKGNGKAKKQLVMGAVSKAVHAADDVRQIADQVLPIVDGLIDVTVQAMNENGLWPDGQAALRTVQAVSASSLAVVRAVDDGLDSVFPSAGD